MLISRRSFLQRGSLLAASAAVWPSWMPRMVFRKDGEDPSGDILIVVFARGGYDGLNMVIPYLDEGYYFTRRPTVAIPAPDDTSAPSRAYDLDGDFGMHPVLGSPDAGRWKEWFDQGILGIVHAVHQTDPTRSHFDAMDYMERGTPGEKRVQSGWIGRHLQTMVAKSDSPFRAVGMGTMLQASLRGPVPAVTLQSIADFHLQGRTDEIARFQEHLSRLYGGDGWLDQEGQQTFAALDLLQERIGTGEYRPQNGAVYLANDGFHQGMRQIAQLIRADVGLEAACIDLGGWDTHANQVNAGDPTAGNMAARLRSLSTGVTALITDLMDRFDPTDRSDQGITIVVMSEFGRRAFENGGLGTDHGHGNAMFAFGRGINGGKVYTNPWPGLADEDLDRGDLRGTTEYRDVLAEILEKRIGNDRVGEVFPGHVFNYMGLARPIESGSVEPTPIPEPTEETPDRDRKIFLPWAGSGG